MTNAVSHSTLEEGVGWGSDEKTWMYTDGERRLASREVVNPWGQPEVAKTPKALTGSVPTLLFLSPEIIALGTMYWKVKETSIPNAVTCMTKMSHGASMHDSSFLKVYDWQITHATFQKVPMQSQYRWMTSDSQGNAIFCVHAGYGTCEAVKGGCGFLC